MVYDLPPYPSSAKPCCPLFQQILVQTEFSPMSLIAITLNKVFSCVLLFDAIFALTEGTFRLCKYPILHQTFNLFIFVFVPLWNLIFIFCSICILYFDGQNIPDLVVKVTLWGDICILDLHDPLLVCSVVCLFYGNNLSRMLVTIFTNVWTGL